MYNIKYLYKAYSAIDTFINSYKIYFIKLYSDTGIDDEEIIIKNYLDIGNKLYFNIKLKIKETLGNDMILGIHLDENNNKYLVLSLNNIKMFIYYSENIISKQRYIDDIKFYRK